MFHLSIKLFGETLCFEVSHLASRSSFTVLPQHGGALHTLVLSDGKMPQPILAPSPSYEDLLTSQSYRGAKLSPFPNRIKGGKYQFQGKEYQLPLNGDKEKNALHGFLYNQSFEQEHFSTEDEKAALLLKHEYDGTIEGFPFPYMTQILYHFGAQSLSCTTIITNTGTQPMPYGDGWHPYFQLGGTLDDWELQLPSGSQQIVLGADKIPTGERLVEHQWRQRTALEGQQLDHAFQLLEQQENKTQLINPITDHVVEIWQDESLPYLQLYTPADRASIAIEPMSCNVNAFNNKEGLVVIPPRDVFTSSFEIHLKNMD